MSFEQELAKSLESMDPDAARELMRYTVYEVMQDDIEANRRTLDAHADRVLKSLSKDISKSLKTGDNDLITAAVLGVVSKGSWRENDHRRDKQGRFAKLSFNIEVGGKHDHGSMLSAGKQTAQSYNAKVGSKMDKAGEEITAFQERWNREGKGGSNDKTYNRLAAGGKALKNLSDPRAKAVGATAEFVGKYGPEAENVVGPAVRRTAYRYRGTEKKIDTDLVQRNNQEIMSLNNHSKENITPELRTHASQRTAVGFLSSRLPDKRLAELQQASGKVPPSEGIIIGADGKMLTQSVGYQEDHYLPFNLKNLKGLQGGSYVRTRSSGGLTGEDIYTGLLSGARSVTVVSRSGVFTVDFDDTLRGGRRYSDKARQMTKQYENTLGAISEKNVSRRGVTPEEKATIRSEIEEEMGEFSSQEEMQGEFQRRVKDFRQRDTLSESELNKISMAAMTEMVNTPGGTQGKNGSMGNLPADDKARYNVIRNDMIEHALSDKQATKHRLDGEGYKTAMEALQEQYPYFISDVRSTPLRESGNFGGETDAGYVKRGKLRPVGIGDKPLPSTRSGRSSETKTESKEEEKEPAPAGAASDKQKMRQRAEMGYQSVQADKKLKSAAEFAASRMDEADAKTYADVVNYASSESPSSAQRAAAVEQLRDYQKALAGAGHSDVAQRLDSDLGAFDSLESMVGGQAYSPENPGRLRKNPATFEGAAYLPGAAQAQYDKEYAKQAQKAKTTSGFKDDEELAATAALYGVMAEEADAAASDDWDPGDAMQNIVRAAGAAGISQERAYHAANNVISQMTTIKNNNGDLGELKTDLMGTHEAIERMRRIKMASSNSTTETGTLHRLPQQAESQSEGRGAMNEMFEKFKAALDDGDVESVMEIKNKVKDSHMRKMMDAHIDEKWSP